ncbi:MAG: tRNA-dihydrouridine synthase, partial [Candidatus Sedimenticola sp. 6PFRAG5]
PQKARQVLELTGVDGIMVGRAAQGRPWVFQEIAHYLKTGQTLARPDPQWICNILMEHLENLYEFYGEYMGVRVARKHIAWYSKTQPGGAEFRKTINQTESAEKQLAEISAFFEQIRANKELAA